MTNPMDKTDTLQDEPMTPEQFRQSHTALPPPTPQLAEFKNEELRQKLTDILFTSQASKVGDIVDEIMQLVNETRKDGNEG